MKSVDLGLTIIEVRLCNENKVGFFDCLQGVLESASGSSATLSAPLDFIPLHVRGGYILPTQEPATSTMFRSDSRFRFNVYPKSTLTLEPQPIGWSRDIAVHC